MHLCVAEAMNSFGKLRPSAESYLQSLADVACSTGFVDRVWCVVEDCEAFFVVCFGSGHHHLQESCGKCWERFLRWCCCAF